MSNFSLLGCIELLLLFLTIFRVKGGGGGVKVTPIYFSWVEISLHVEFQPLGLSRSALQVCVGGGWWVRANLVIAFG